jgi:hypothetical protein
MVNAPVGIGNVEGITLEAPFPSDAIFGAADRFGLLLESPEAFAGDFGAVVFAITLFLYGWKYLVNESVGH